MNLTEYLLTQAASECNEVAHRISKAQQFGLHEVQEGQLDNAARIIEEFIDLLAVFDMLDDAGIIDLPTRAKSRSLIERKKDKVRKYMKYAETCGTLDLSVKEQPL